jgi:type II secretory pathway pseudopilin PulG
MPAEFLNNRLLMPNRQRGQALIAITVLLGITLLVTIYALTRPVNQAAVNQQKTADALAQAKAALIGYAASHPTHPGELPCPATDDNGTSVCSGSSWHKTLGRFPWNSLGLPDLRDSSGEHLWYAASPDFLNPTEINSSITPLNPLTVVGISRPSPIVAIIFAPGPPINNENRNGVTNQNNYANYLENANPIGYQYTSEVQSSSFNDQILVITQDDVFSVVNNRIASEIRGTAASGYGLEGFYNDSTKHYYPWAADSTGAPVTHRRSGLVPYTVLSFTPATNTMLMDNNWFSVATYEVAPNFDPATTYPQNCGINNTGCLSVNGYAQAQARVTVPSATSIICVNNGAATCP